MTDLEVGRYALRSFRFQGASLFGGMPAGERILSTLFGGLPYRSSDEAMSVGEWAARHRHTDMEKSRWVAPSYSHSADWGDGTCSAVCRRYPSNKPKHDAPHDGCSCGIYGSLSYADLLHSFRNEAKWMVAVIAAEGTTIIGTRGLRTQFARVVGFWVDPTWVFSEWRDCQQMPSLTPVPARIARRQFKDAEEFGDPLALVEAFGLALLPPSQAKELRASSNEYWTATPGE